MSKFEIFPGNAEQEGKIHQQWYWRLKSKNGEIVCQSEGYTTPEDAERGAENMARVCTEALLENISIFYDNGH